MTTPEPSGFVAPIRALLAEVRASWVAPYLDHVLHRWRTVAAYALLAGAAGAAVALIMPTVYVARASLIADTPNPPQLSGALAQVAGQFGVLGLGSGNRAPTFYRDLIESRRTLTALVSASVHDPAQPGHVVPVYSVYSGGKIDSLTRRKTEDLLRVLGRRIATTVDERTSIIRVELGAPNPDQAAEILDSLLSLTNQFAVTNLRTRARLRREFVETQTSAARANLEVAEDSLRQFNERNRRLTDSPTLQFEEARLRRRVDLRQDLYLALSRELDQARIDEVRDTPVLDVIDAPVPPSRHEVPNRRALVLLAVLFGVLAAVAGLVLERSRTIAR
jgi:uncharacterized protein involved in exopolysaccharide biosynthesis